MDGDPESVDLVDITSRPRPPTRNESATADGHRSRRPVLVAALLAAAALAVLFFLARSDQQSRQSAIRQVPTPTAPTPTAAPLDESVAAAVDDATNEPARAPAPLDVPVLGRPSGWWLFYGGEDQLQRLNLDTGVVHNFEIRAAPIASDSGELIISAHASNFVGRVGLDDPGEQAQGWIKARPARIDEPGFLWLYTAYNQSWTKHDLSTDRLVETRYAPGQIFPPRRADLQHLAVNSPHAIATASGIYLFEEQRGQYVRRAFGRVLETRPNRLLVEACDPRLDCATGWVFSDTWRGSGDWPPGEGLESALLLGDDGWLHTIRRDGTAFLQSTSTGERTQLGQNAKAIAVSPDGSWLATLRRDGGIDLTHLASGETLDPIDVFDDDLGGALLFVEMS